VIRKEEADDHKISTLPESIFFKKSILKIVCKNDYLKKSIFKQS